MQVATCRVGGAVSLSDRSRIDIYSRQGDRICLGATAPAGTELILGGASVCPIAGRQPVWTYLFSLQALRRFVLGEFEVHVWLPGELVPHAAGCEDWLHVGVVPASDHASVVPWSAPATPAFPLVQVEDGGGWLLSRIA
ncbi:MAG: hypothetical protein JNM58_17520 [Xanthomonadaceae bacterium]|nr:hypothetical protein [Xanthomonadaceae bacterium]